MATHEIRTCDRCGEVIGHRKGMVSRITRIKQTLFFGLGPYDYSNWNYDLCDSCTTAFDKFLKGEEEHGQPNN